MNKTDNNIPTYHAGERLDTIKDQLMSCLCDFADDDDRFMGELENIRKKHGSQVFTVFFHILTNLDLKPGEAAECWEKVAAHCLEMSVAQGRRVSLRTAICDYFCSINKSLQNPKIIEIHVFENESRYSRYDGLTGLLNRRSFDEVLLQEYSRAERHKIDLSLLFFDLDDFKNVNDTYGHLAGDKVLKQVSDIIIEEKRIEDIAARYGGEEMVVIVPGTAKVNALVLGERIRKRIEALVIEYDNRRISLTISGGLASYPFDAAEDSSELIKFADNALYRAKNLGKNNISLYSLDKRRDIRIDFEREIKVRKLDYSTMNLRAKAKSLSTGGVLFESNVPLDIGSHVQIRITIEDKPLEVIGNVVRVEAFGPEQYDISLSFKDAGPVQKNEISRSLIHYLKNQVSDSETN